MNSEPLLHVGGLTLEVGTSDPERLLRGVDLAVMPAEIHALVGESGAGKSLTARAIMGILPGDPNLRVAGNLLFAGRNLDWVANAAPRVGISLIFQDPSAFLNPGLRLFDQVVEIMRFSRLMERDSAIASATELLASLDLGPAESQRYPFQLSGGMQQRAMLALALTVQPRLLLADEPASALDIVNRRRVYGLLRVLRDEKALSVLLISHDIAGLEGYADRISIMYAGRIVETLLAHDFFSGLARHPYTKALILAQPKYAMAKTPLAVLKGKMPSPHTSNRGCLFADRCPNVQDLCQEKIPDFVDGVACHAVSRTFSERVDNGPARPEISLPERQNIFSSVPVILEIKNLSKKFDNMVLDNVSLQMRRGETVGLIGGSGSGKTTLARCLLGLEQADSGLIRLEGFPAIVAGQNWKRHIQVIRRADRGIALVFQDTRGSLNPGFTVGQCLAEAVPGLNRDLARDRIHQALDLVSLSKRIVNQASHRLSGGQRQRVVIARALMRQPRALILDEPVASLDVSVQAQVLDSLQAIQRDLEIAYLFISHDLDIIRYMSDRVAMLVDGQIVEVEDSDLVASAGHHLDNRDF